MSLILSKPAPCIFVYENAVDTGKEFVDLIEDEAKNEWSSLSWTHSQTGRGTISEFRSSRLCSLESITNPCPDTKLSKLFNSSILFNINKCIGDYAAYHGLPSMLLGEGWTLLKYEGEAQYRTHWDHGPENTRILSVVCFPYSTATSGGELTFPHFDVSVKPISGSVVIFPSNFPYTHTAHPVEEGIKYSLVTWFR